MICAKLGEIETSKLSTSLLLCELIDIYTCLNYFFGPSHACRKFFKCREDDDSSFTLDFTLDLVVI